MKSKYLTLALAGLCLSTGSLSAWERSAMSDCKKDMESCKQDANRCKKDSTMTPDDCKKMMDDCKTNMDSCKKGSVAKDNSSFEMSLSNYNRSRFKNFSADQKKSALDYADKNKMSPDDAVMKVADSMKK